MRLIDADALNREIDKVECYSRDPDVTHMSECIANAPTVDAEPVRHGKWMPREEGVVYPFWERYTCSVCGKHADDTDYCPNCGARMVKDD